MRTLNKWTLFIALDVMLFVALLFTSVQVVVYNDTYFRWHYGAHEIETATGMDVDQLMAVTDKMMDYLIDKRDTLDMTSVIDGTEQEVFGEREKAHMVDVKDLFMQGKVLRDLSVITLLLLVLYMMKKERVWLVGWLSQLLYFFIGAFAVIGGLALLFATDFNKYFTMFHEIFFDNDLWLLDPKTDILINMVPEIFFFQTAMLIAAGFIISIGLILVVSKIVVERLEI